MKHSKITYALSCLLAFCVPCSMTTLSVEAVEPDTAQTAAEAEEVFVLPDIISPADAEEYGFVGRNYEAEKDLNTFVFKNADGSATMKVFSHPVKYADEFGKIRDISLDLVKLPDNSMVTVDNSIKTTFPPSLSDGIAVACEDIDLLMVPVTGGTSPTAVFDDKENKVTYHVDNATDYVYGLTYTGFKEDIMVSEYTGQTDYHFTLYTNGLTLTEEDDTLMLTDEKGKTAAVLSDVIVYTADGGNNTIGSMTYQTVEDNQQYNLTVHLDEAYLSDEATVYPIRIDPSITVNSGSNGIVGKTIYSDGTTSSGLTVGKTQGNEKARFFIGFPNLDLSSIRSSLGILTAKIELTNNPLSAYSVYVQCCQFGDSWYSDNKNWNNLYQDDNANNYTLLAQKAVSTDNGAILSPQHRYAFDIKLAVQRWHSVQEVINDEFVPSSVKNNVFNPSKGLIFKSLAENGSIAKFKNFANCLNASSGPSLTITYTTGIPRNQFFSKYDPIRYNSYYANTPAAGSDVDLMRYRMNCYGYAFGCFLNSVPIYAMGDIPQSPGVFSNDPSLNTTSTLSAYLDSIQDKLELDAEELGYTVTEYTGANPGSPTIPQYGENSRMIAVAVRNTETSKTYHWYMQHNDGTWSSKNSSNNIDNRALAQNSDGYRVILTNDNIYNNIFVGDYVNGLVRFFIITKPSKMLPYERYNQTNIFYYSSVGDYAENSNQTAVNSTYSTTQQIDYMMDDDLFFVEISNSRYYTITASISSSSLLEHIKFELYKSDGQQLASVSGNTTAYTYVYLTAGTQYYLRIYDDTIHKSSNCVNPITYCYNTPGEYLLSIL